MAVVARPPAGTLEVMGLADQAVPAGLRLFAGDQVDAERFDPTCSGALGSRLCSRVVPAEGVEPTHPHGYQILSLARLPIPPRRPPMRTS